MNPESIKVQIREDKKCNKIRKEGQVPGVLYGRKRKNLNVSLSRIDIERELKLKKLLNKVYEIDINSKKEKVMFREIAFHPVNSRIIHLDIFSLEGVEDFIFEVPIIITGRERSVGIRNGGILNLIRPKIPLICSPNNVPEKIEIDISNLKIGETVKVQELILPPQTKLTKKNIDFAVLSIVSNLTKETTAQKQETSESTEKQSKQTESKK